MVVSASWVVWRLWRWRFSRVASLMLMVLFATIHSALPQLTQVVPWNTIPTQLSLLAGVWVFWDRTNNRGVSWLASLAAITYLIRPVDAACFAPMLVWAVLRLPTWRERITHGLLGMGIAAMGVATVGLVNLAVFGSWNSPYVQVSLAAVGFNSYPATFQWFWLLVDGSVFFGEEGAALVFRYPWLLLVPSGAIWWIRRDGVKVAIILATVLLSWGLYFRYNDFVPSGIFRFSLIHYLTWSFPLLFGLAVAGGWFGWRDRICRMGLVLAVLLAVIMTGLDLSERVLPVEVGPGWAKLPESRPLWVQFPKEPLEKSGAIRLDGRALQESRDYHIPYVPSDLRLLLGCRAQGTKLELTTGTTTAPQVGDYDWSWRWEPTRWWPPRD